MIKSYLKSLKEIKVFDFFNFLLLVTAKKQTNYLTFFPFFKILASSGLKKPCFITNRDF